MSGGGFLVALRAEMSARSAQVRFHELVACAAVAGGLVGVIDGARAAVVGRTDAAGFVASLGLVAGLDAVVAVILGLVAATLWLAARWGRNAVTPRLATILGWLVAACLPAAAAIVAVALTATRHNRFLAAGVVTLAVAVAAVVAALLGPAAARLMSPGFGRARAGEASDPLAEPAGSSLQLSATPAGLLVVAPAVALAFLAAAFVPVVLAHAPLRGRKLLQHEIMVAVIVAGLPFVVAWAARRFPRWSLRRAAAVSVLVFVLPAVAVVILRWEADFRFVRWSDVMAVGAMAAITGALIATRRLARRGAGLVAVVSLVLGAALVLGTAGAESARKAAMTHAGLVGPVLGHARTALDLDRDGYPFLLGGGDCDDRDKEVNPAAQEWPGDGIDQNCDGKDAIPTAIRSQPFARVPDAVAPDLNVLFITVDTLRADRLGSYGYGRPTSPALDALAKDGIVFQNGWAHAPSTRYSMPALATGRWPSTITWEDCGTCERNWPRIAPGHPMIGEVMKAAGFHTAAYFAFIYFKREYRRGFERGIDDYRADRADLHIEHGGPHESRGSSSREISDDAIAFVDAKGKGQKWFLWLHYFDPHLDYQRHPESPDFGNTESDRYDSEVWFTDHHIGRVFQRLKTLGLWDKTVVFVTGDHGEGFGERGISAHGYHLYPPQTRVPFIWRVPGLAPRQVTQPVSHVDVAPTLLNLARGKPEKSFLGRSMVDLMASGAPAKDVPVPPVFQEVTYEGPTSPIDGTRKRGLVTSTHHLIWNWLPENTTECYELTTDRLALRDLWGTNRGAACLPMKSDLQDLVQAVSLPLDLGEKLAAAVTPPGKTAPAPQHALSAKIGEFVRFLGYDLSAPRVSRSEGELFITYHFEVLTPPPDGWRPFFHLDGPAGVLNLDHDPVEGAYPLRRWRPGQRIRDRQRIVITPAMPAGTYTVHTGFYRRNERLPIDPPAVSDGQSRLRVASFTVQ